jgi:hypothetical protein
MSVCIVAFYKIINIAQATIKETGFFPKSLQCNEVSRKNPVSGHSAIMIRLILVLFPTPSPSWMKLAPKLTLI